MAKELKDMKFGELVDEMARNIHSALLLGGGSSMTVAVHLAMNTAIEWQRSSIKSDNKNGLTYETVVREMTLINLIKLIRNVSGLSLLDAKRLAEKLKREIR